MSSHIAGMINSFVDEGYVYVPFVLAKSENSSINFLSYCM